MLSADAAFRKGTHIAASKSDYPVRSDHVMRKYSELFEAEFGANSRMFEISGPGLFLGTKIITVEQAMSILTETKNTALPDSARLPYILPKQAIAETLEKFVASEKEKLLRLRGMLTGEIPFAQRELDEILNDCDYLWAHFPDCAETGGRRPDAADISFLKRVRTEIDPFLKLWR